VAEINLLKQKSSGSSFASALPSLLAKLLILVALAAAAYYGWLFLEEKKAAASISNLQIEIASAKKDALSRPERYELLTRQGQLKELASLSGNYEYFTKLFKPLADNTLKRARYTGIKATEDGQVTLSAVVPSLVDLDKYFQLFNTSSFSANFTNVKVGGFYKIKEKDFEQYTFEIKMDFDPGMIKAK
jgi:hypothetical protein